MCFEDYDIARSSVSVTHLPGSGNTLTLPPKKDRVAIVIYVPASNNVQVSNSVFGQAAVLFTITDNTTQEPYIVDIKTHGPNVRDATWYVTPVTTGSARVEEILLPAGTKKPNLCNKYPPNG